MRFRPLGLCLFTILLFSAAASAQQYDQVIANSADWRDVYSTVVYGKLQGYQTNFLVGQPHANILLFSIPKDRKVQIVSSSRNSYAIGYKSLFESQGYTGVDELTVSDININLARRLTQTRSFIILDDSYGYNAISVAPYAQVTKSYVLFADRRNINQVVDLLTSRGNVNVTIYGDVDREVRTRLAPFNPSTINEGDRYLNNVAIVKKYMAIHGTQQVLFSNGEFIEDQLMTGNEPVLFIGNNNVPDAIATYIKNSDIKVGILIGNELITTATTIRRQLGISVFVKFAQSARTPGGTVDNVEDLDRYPLPKFALNMQITSVKYNELTKQLEVTYRNLVDQGTYLKGTIVVRSDEGTQTVGDLEPVFIEGNEYLTLTYPFTEELTGEITAEVYTLFGESRKSFEYSLRQTFKTERVSVRDDTIIELVDLIYDARSDEFTITVRNPGSVDTYVNLEIFDILVNGAPISFGSKDETLIAAGKSVKIKIKVDDLTPEDIAENPKVTVIARYGARQNILTKTLRAEFDLNQKGPDYLFYSLVVVVIILFLHILSRKKCKHCRRRTGRFARVCPHCGNEL